MSKTDDDPAKRRVSIAHDAQRVGRRYAAAAEAVIGPRLAPMVFNRSNESFGGKRLSSIRSTH